MYKLCGSGKLWEVLGSFGKLWEALGGSGRLWEALGSSGRLWEDLGCFGKLWEALGGSGKLREALGRAGANGLEVQSQAHLARMYTPERFGGPKPSAPRQNVYPRTVWGLGSECS